MLMPSRILKLATDFLAFVTTGRCPEINVKSLIAASSALGLSLASPTPMLITTFSKRGASRAFLYWKRAIKAGRTSFKYFY